MWQGGKYDPGTAGAREEGLPPYRRRERKGACQAAGLLTCIFQMPQGQTPAQMPQPMQRAGSDV